MLEPHRRNPTKWISMRVRKDQTADGFGATLLFAGVPSGR